jgi:hypothetical protein
VNPYVTEIAAMVVVLIAGLWTACAEVDDDRPGAASTAVGRRFARCALGATVEAAPLIAAGQEKEAVADAPTRPRDAAMSSARRAGRNVRATTRGHRRSATAAYADVTNGQRT